MPEYKLPDVGEGLTEAEIVTWRVAVGDTVKVNDIVVEIETAKSIVELPTPYAGEVTALLVPEGEMVTVGTPIIAIGEAVSGVVTPVAPGPKEVATAPAPVDPEQTTAPIDTNIPPEGQATLVGYGPKQRDLKRRARTGGAAGAPVGASGGASAGAPAAPPTPAAALAQPAPVASAGSEASTGSEVNGAGGPGAAAGAAAGGAVGGGDVRVLAKPPVRKLARDLGVDLTTLTPSGPDGTVSREDVQSAAAGAGEEQRMPASYPDLGRPGVAAMAGARETREPIKGVRRMMASAMSASAFTAPHVTEWMTVDVTATMRLVERLRGRREFRDLKVGPLLVLARAVMLAMRRTPVINSTWDEDAQEIVLKGYVNLGIAAATPRGLVVPNVKDADRLTLVELAGALADLTATAREGRAQPAEMSNGTFTITNVGVFGVDAGTPIINPGESAILCFGAINKRPWVDEETGELCVRDVTTLALSFDHRHIDGAAGSTFLADVAALLHDPATALLY